MRPPSSNWGYRCRESEACYRFKANSPESHDFTVTNLAAQHQAMQGNVATVNATERDVLQHHQPHRARFVPLASNSSVFTIKPLRFSNNDSRCNSVWPLCPVVCAT